MNPPNRDSFDEPLEERTEARLRALNTRDPRCSHPGCRECNPLALTGTDPNILCREHAADRHESSWTEQHHPVGRRNDPQTVPLPANDHAVLSELQALWPRETLRNPDGSPLRKAAAALRGWLDILRLIVERTVGWIPPFLETLDVWLCERLGPRWWQALGWE